MNKSAEPTVFGSGRMSSAPERTKPIFSEPKGGEERRSFRCRMTRPSRKLNGRPAIGPLFLRHFGWSRLRAPNLLKFAPHVISAASDVCGLAKVASTSPKLPPWRGAHPGVAPTLAWRPFRAAPSHPTRLRRVLRWTGLAPGPSNAQDKTRSSASCGQSAVRHTQRPPFSALLPGSSRMFLTLLDASRQVQRGPEGQGRHQARCAPHHACFSQCLAPCAKCQDPHACFSQCLAPPQPIRQECFALPAHAPDLLWRTPP